MARRSSSEARSLVALFEQRVHAAGSSVALLGRQERGWSPCSWQQWWEAAERLAAALLELGVKPGDRVALLAHTRVEWAWADLAIMMLGCAVVPLYPTHTGEQLGWALDHAEVSALILEDPALLERLPASLPDALRFVALMDAESLTGGGLEPVRRLRAEDLAIGWLESRPVYMLDALIAQGRRALAVAGMQQACRRSTSQLIMEQQSPSTCRHSSIRERSHPMMSTPQRYSTSPTRLSAHPSE